MKKKNNNCPSKMNKRNPHAITSEWNSWISKNPGSEFEVWICVGVTFISDGYTDVFPCHPDTGRENLSDRIAFIRLLWALFHCWLMEDGPIHCGHPGQVVVGHIRRQAEARCGETHVPLISALGRQGKVNLCEFKIRLRLVYITSSKPVWDSDIISQKL